jgi:hypothetical protein
MEELDLVALTDEHANQRGKPERVPYGGFHDRDRLWRAEFASLHAADLHRKTAAVYHVERGVERRPWTVHVEGRVKRIK